VSYRERVRHRHGTFKWRSGGKQWIGRNQFVHALNNYEMKIKTLRRFLLNCLKSVFLANHKYGMDKNTDYVTCHSDTDVNNGDSSFDQLVGCGSDIAIWYTSGYTALARFFR
jgi:ribosomal protein S27AE